MLALISFIGIVVISMIIIRIGTIALVLTGLSHEVASFQAQSAFSGVGFTTAESEFVVSNPVRRKILRLMMLLGSAGLTTAITTLLLTFIGKSGTDVIIRVGVIAATLIIILFFSYSKWFNRFMNKVIENFLKKRAKLNLKDYEYLFGLSRGFAIAEFTVKKDSWLADKRLKDLHLNDEGILVLGIYRKNNRKVEEYLGAPWGETMINSKDRLICYGKSDTIENLVKRNKGRKGAVEHIQISKEAKEIKKATSTL